MKVFTFLDCFESICMYTKSWGLYISWKFQDISDGNLFDYQIKELLKAAPYLDLNNGKHLQCMLDESCILLFDTEEEAYKHFNLTVGDEGPTETNPYNGPFKVYAALCNPQGDIQDENT